MNKLKIILINLLLFVCFDQLVGVFMNDEPEYLNRSKYPWGAYSSNYRGYFDKITKDNLSYFGFNRKWDDRIYLSKPIPENKRRILTIGDSFTYGQGVRFKDNYTSQIANINKELVGINLGVSGNNIYQVEKSLNSHIEKIKPEHVFYGYCLNDMLTDDQSNIKGMEYNTKTKPIKDIGLKWDFINKRTTQIDLGRDSKIYKYLKFSPIFKKIYKAVELKNISGQTIQHYKDLYSVEKNQSGIQATIDKILNMQNKSFENNSKFTVIVFPIIFWPNKYYFLESEHKIFIETLRKNNINYIDMKDEWLKFEDRDLWVHPVDQHPNNIAHDLVARKIIKLLNKLE